MRWRHPVAGAIEQQPSEQEGRRLGICLSIDCIGRERGLNCIKSGPVDNGLVVGRVNLALV